MGAGVEREIRKGSKAVVDTITRKKCLLSAKTEGINAIQLPNLPYRVAPTLLLARRHRLTPTTISVSPAHCSLPHSHSHSHSTSRPPPHRRSGNAHRRTSIPTTRFRSCCSRAGFCHPGEGYRVRRGSARTPCSPGAMPRDDRPVYSNVPAGRARRCRRT